MRKICVWPDYTWCEISQIEECNWKSDDYIVINTIMCDDDIEKQIHLLQFERTVTPMVVDITTQKDLAKKII